MGQTELAAKRIATRPSTYDKLSQYASGLGVPMSDAIEDLLAQALEASGVASLEDAGWQRRKANRDKPARA